MSATAEVVVKQAEGINVPTSAISADTVTVMRNGKQVRQRVVTGLAGNSSTIILSGLKAGETVVLPTATSTASSSRTLQPPARSSSGGLAAAALAAAEASAGRRRRLLQGRWLMRRPLRSRMESRARVPRSRPLVQARGVRRRLRRRDTLVAARIRS